MTKHIAVIGGGMAGTSAAYSLMKQGYTVTILEKNDYLGGRMHTHLVDGAAVEMGAAFMNRLYANMRAFLRESSLEIQLYRQSSLSGILRDGHIRMATLRTLAGNGALSWRAKLQVVPLLLKALLRWRLLDLHTLWRGDAYDDMSVASMFSQPNNELLEYLIQPMLDGYFYWAPEHVSSVMLLGICKVALVQRGVQGSTLKMKCGLQLIPETAAQGATVLLGHTVQSVRRRKDKTYTVMVMHNGTSKTLQADGIVCATTASVVPTIFADLTEQQRSFFQAVHYSSTALVARTYNHEQTRGNKGVAFPRREGIELSCITLAREPGGAGNLATLKTYASGTIGKQLCEESDETIIRKLTSMMEPVRETVLVGNPKPIATHIQRWPEALPFFDVGHFRRLRSFENGDIEDPSHAIVFAGDYLGGPFMEGAFTSGTNAAKRLNSRIDR